MPRRSSLVTRILMYKRRCVKALKAGCPASRVTAFLVSRNPAGALPASGIFKNLAAETGIPYQNPINLTLRECVQTGKTPTLSWAS